MDASCLEYKLSDEERQQFEETGILQIDNALSPETVERLVSAMDRIHEREKSAGRVKANERLHFPNFVPEDPAFADLVDYEGTFPKVWGLLGWNIYLYHGHLSVVPPSGEARVDKTLGWHQDSARMNTDIETHPRPRLSLKVGYFLSDTSEEGRGNFWVVPGSHLRDDLDLPSDPSAQPEGAVPVLAKPGTAVFFDRRLWHASSPNWSDVTRRVLFYGYGYRWIRTKDDMTVHELWDESSPIRRQLLGYSLNAEGHYRPTEEEAPLRAWLTEHQPSAITAKDARPGHALPAGAVSL